jgi:hypothetical protein
MGMLVFQVLGGVVVFLMNYIGFYRLASRFARSVLASAFAVIWFLAGPNTVLPKIVLGGIAFLIAFVLLGLWYWLSGVVARRRDEQERAVREAGFYQRMSQQDAASSPYEQPPHQF